MIQNILILFFTGLILLLPLVFWMYVFVSFFQYGVSRKQFLLGMFAGSISLIPLVYQNSFFIGDMLSEMFFQLSILASGGGMIALFISLLILFSCIWGMLFMGEYFLQKKKNIFLKKYILSVFAFIVLLFLGVGIMSIFMNVFSKELLDNSASFGDIVFVSLGGILSYYVLVSFLEEGTKYVSTLSFSGGETFEKFQRYMCLSACVALGFSFFENISYTIAYVQGQGVSSSLLRLVFFRSIFSVILHIVSSMLFAMAFWYVFSVLKNTGRKILNFFFFASLAIASHVFFDVVLTFGYMGYIFLYIVAIYLFLTYITTSSEK